MHQNIGIHLYNLQKMQPEAVTFLADRKDASLYSIPGVHIRYHFDLLRAVSSAGQYFNIRDISFDNCGNFLISNFNIYRIYRFYVCYA